VNELDEVRQIIVIRKDLKMRKGKMVAQGAHASMKPILDQLYSDEGTLNFKMDKNNPIYNWINGSFVKIVVGVNSLEELEELESEASKSNILVSKITDEGRTTFNNNITVTALAIGPEWKSKLEPITGNLKLL